MNILPKFTYLFQCLPVFIPKTFFNKLNSILSTFIWNGRPQRLSWTALQQPKRLGGMAAPNFIYYYWAANIRPIVHWLYEDLGADAPSWLQLEAASCHPSSHSPLVFSNTVPPTDYTKNIIVKCTVKIWIQFRHHSNWTSISLKAPMQSNHLFKPALLDKVYSVWEDRGIKTFSDLYDNGIFMSFTKLTDKYQLQNRDFFPPFTDS